MRNDILSFILGSENRKIIVNTILDYPKRQWSCSALEDLTKIPHATVFRTLKGLKNYSVLKTIKINKKDIVYELVQNNLTNEIKRVLNIEITTAKSSANEFINFIKDKINAAVLYGSIAKGTIESESDIDVLLVVKNKNNDKEIFDIAAKISSKNNRVISPVIMEKKEILDKANKQFIDSVKENMEVLYGKAPF